jgi:hypothetical protein
MSKKSLLLAGALFLSSFTVAYAKSYDVRLTSTAQAGKVELVAGEYKLKVDGDTATFTNNRSKSFTTPVKVQNAEKKYPTTAVETNKIGDKQVVKAIYLGGSTTRIEFLN